jgi:hypothetical protein
MSYGSSCGHTLAAARCSSLQCTMHSSSKCLRRGQHTRAALEHRGATCMTNFQGSWCSSYAELPHNHAQCQGSVVLRQQRRVQPPVGSLTPDQQTLPPWAGRVGVQRQEGRETLHQLGVLPTAHRLSCPTPRAQGVKSGIGYFVTTCAFEFKGTHLGAELLACLQHLEFHTCRLEVSKAWRAGAHAHPLHTYSIG